MLLGSSWVLGSTKNAPNYNHFSIQQYLILSKKTCKNTGCKDKIRNMHKFKKIGVELFLKIMDAGNGFDFSAN